ncbi:MAG: hypothetical protein QF925_04860 [Dehalococcoidia bacterium]|jgi:Mn-containing catalase|nr:hypothetical protein [Dehalococcoidia bacterium]
MVTVTYARQGWEVDNPGITKHLEIIQEYAGIDSASNLTIVGQMVGEMVVEALEIAGDDLTRENLIEAVESIENFLCSVCLVPATMSSGDHDPFQGAYLMRAEDGIWKTFSDLISYEGTLSGTMSAADVKE